MNSLNLDPGLQKAFTQQTYQRLLTESTQAYRAKLVSKKSNDPLEVRFELLWLKLKIVAQVLQDAASIIHSIMKAGNYPTRI